MGAHAGSEGIVKIADNQIAEVKSWSLEEVCDTVDASIIGTQWRKNLATIKSWSGSIEAFWDESDENGQGKLALGSTIIVNLYPEGVGETQLQTGWKPVGWNSDWKSRTILKKYYEGYQTYELQNVDLCIH